MRTDDTLKNMRGFPHPRRGLGLLWTFTTPEAENTTFALFLYVKILPLLDAVAIFHP